MCGCVYACMTTHIAKIWINRVRLPILLVVSRTGKNNIPLYPFAPENLVSRDGFGSPVPRQPAHLHCMATHIARVWINRITLPILLVVGYTEKMNISLSPFAPENLVTRDRFGSPVPRPPAHLHIQAESQAESGTYSRDSSRVLRRRPFIYLNRHTPSGHAIAYRWHSLARVRRHRTSKPQGSSKRLLPWQVTIDQSICASLSHTHYWYEVGMLQVPAVY